jgi:hypothetical protein
MCFRFDESSESKSDDLTTIVIKGKVSSSKSLFLKLSKHTCLMVKECRKKVKFNTSCSLKYVTSDDNILSSELVKNSNVMIKGLIRQVEVGDVLFEQQEELLVQERKISKEPKKFLALEKGKVEKID